MPPSNRGTLGELFALLKPFRLLASVSILLGMAGGLAITLLLAQINQALHNPTALGKGLVLTFAGLCVLALSSSIVSDIGTNYVGQRIIAGLRKSLGEKVLCAPIEQIERYRTHKLIPVLTHDIDTISDFSFSFTPLAIALTVTLGCLGYLAWLSLPMFAVLMVALVVGTVVQYIARSHGIRGFDQARDEEDELQRHYTAVANGAKELRIHRARRQRMHSARIQATADRIAGIQVRSVNLYILAKSFGSMLFFVVIGIALAMQHLWPNPDPSVMTGFVLVLLYMKGPIEHVVVALPIIGRAQVAFRRVAELSAQFSSPEPHLLQPDAPTASAVVPQSLELRGVRYSPPAVVGSEPFHFGPVDLRIAAGEITFIVGENGSGKTTLIKLLLGLYTPQGGEIRLNGQAVGAEQRDDYRQLFSTIFADYHLFDDLVQGTPPALQQAEQYLQRLEIAHKVSVQGGQFSTTDLSTGQRKRLALIHAWLENRPILVFDEWAADQDPAFRRVFYEQLLPDFKRQGKTVIVISHDDRYFGVADQLVHLSGGQRVPASASA